MELFALGLLISDFFFTKISIGNQLFQSGILLSDFGFFTSVFRYTGVYFCNLWIISISWLLYRLIFDKARLMYYMAGLIICMLLPISLSYLLPSQNTCKLCSIAVFSTEKNPDAWHILDTLKQIDFEGIDYTILPEGLISLKQENFIYYPEITKLKRFVNENPNLHIIVGLFSEERTGKIANSVLIISKDGICQRFKKLQIPFSEYIPYPNILGRLQFFQEKILYDLKQGNNIKDLYNIGNRTIAPLICYEALSTQYAVELASYGAQIFLVSSSNSYIADRHIERINIRLMKTNAMITAKGYARATENGISCFISPSGEVLDISEYETSLIKCHMPTNSDRTFYVRHQRNIDLIYFIIITILVIFLSAYNQRFCLKLFSDKFVS